MRANIPKGMGGAGNMQAMLRQAQKMHSLYGSSILSKATKTHFSFFN